MNELKKQAAKTALVTGAAKRIGASLVESLHQAGYKVAIHCNHSLKEAQALAYKLNQERSNSAEVFQADLRTAHACKGLIDAVSAWASRWDLLINNASLFIKNDVLNFPAEIWADLFALNLQAPYELSIHAAPMLKEEQGCIINISDIHAETPLKDYAIYCQTKAALNMQTKALAKAFAPQVRVNAIAPGAILWPENDNALPESIRQKIIAQTPLQCAGHPRYIAKAVHALVQNPFITGHILPVDGGRSIG